MNKINSFYTIIVAGGTGKRMASVLPKQFIELNGKPILMHTISAFAKNIHQPTIILVLAPEEESTWIELVKKHQFETPHQIVYGGEERFHSVKNALAQILDENAIIAIHDGVRPLVSQQTISNCFITAKINGNAIAAIPSKDSVRRFVTTTSESLIRSEIYLVQTPQTFRFEQLKQAYLQEYKQEFTDDASVVEKAGYPIYIEKGDEFNFKVTFKEDILIAEALLKLNQFN
jgi:2-C-methyl-D-erythritol 4-phosphate cytidylyltransferase